MKNKYYTPTLEEFYVGFECEFKNNMQGNTWKYEQCDVDTLSIAFDSIEHEDIDCPFAEEFRVKYLDKEDIESLGYVIVKDVGFELTGQLLPFDKDYEFYEIDYDLDDRELLIERFHRPRLGNIKMDKNEYSTHTLFEGIIKNKSELKQLLKQLRING